VISQWLSASIAIVALVIGLYTSWRQRQLTAALEEGHAGAQTAMQWRDQVIMFHDRGLDPEEIRWIMECESGGEGLEGSNGFIDEIVRNVPRMATDQTLQPILKDPRRRIERPPGRLRPGDGGEAFVE
jgi:hypothetical protein